MSLAEFVLAAIVGVLGIVSASLRSSRRHRKSGRSWIARKLDLPPPKFRNKLLRDWDYAQIDDWALLNADPNKELAKEAIARIGTAPEKSVQALLDLAERGSIWGMLWMAWCYHTGIGVPSDHAKSEDWERRGFEAGSQRALLYYGKLKASQRDFDACEAIFSVGAANDWAPAQYWLACARFWKSRSRATLRRIRPLLESAIARGSPAAKWFLGFYMARGWCGLRDIPAGFRLLMEFVSETRKIVRAMYAAEKGDAAAQYQLGWIYAFGDEIARNDPDAIKMFDLSMAQGNPKAMLAKGWMHAYGRGVSHDPLQTYVLTTVAMDRLPATDPESRQIAIVLRDWARSCLSKTDAARGRRLVKKMAVAQGF